MPSRILIKAFFVYTLVMPALIQSAEPSLYKWIDADGNTHFSDKLPDNIEPEPFQVPELSISGAEFIPRINHTKNNVIEKDKAKKESYYCGQYKKKINKIKIYLKHTPNDLDKQKLADLQQQMKLECRNGVYRKTYKNSSCRSYARKLNKYTIYNKHTPTDRDEQAIKDLQAQIKLECG